MAKDKYSLPEVDLLKNIGFQFEYSKISDAIPYIQDFIKLNFNVLQSVFYFNNASYDESGTIIEMDAVTNTDISDDGLTYNPEKDLIERIERIKSGIIYPKDYIFHVHPVYAKNQEVLVNVLTKKLRALYGANGDLIYNGTRWGLSLEDSIKECFYHKILDNIILRIRDERKIGPSGISENYFKIKEILEEDSVTTEFKEGSLLQLSSGYKNKKKLAYYQGLLFSEGLTLEKSAKLTIWKSRIPGSIKSSILEKERTLKYYLRLQASSVNKARDNARKNKGIQKSNRNKVINVFKSNRKLSHVKIAELTGVSRKTVAKYINAFRAE